MSLRSSRYPRRVVVGLAALLGSAVLGSFAAGNAAATAGCRTDPLVTLSNGTRLTLYEDIADSASDVTAVSYKLHIPVGL
ncbi:MAG TPA: hypothetical protein VKX16_19320, partial [Chloroflexota bacterium]|nr:hypothetical protein [Chloroflexota bacterium]